MLFLVYFWVDLMKYFMGNFYFYFSVNEEII